MATVIDSAGYVISTPGDYVLGANLTYSESTGAAITVTCSNVNIDLAGFTISGNGRDDSSACGIAAQGQTNVDIENGVITGFFAGVLLEDNQSGLGEGQHDISNLTVLDSSFRGIRVSGANSTITDCYINGVGGTTNFANSFAAGIEQFGERGVVSGNVIREVHPVGTGEGLGISISANSDDTIVRDNTIINSSPDGLQGFGVWVGGESTVTLQDNEIVNFENGFAFSSPTNGSYLGNEISGWYETPFSTASSRIVDAGNNSISLTDGDDVFDIDTYLAGPQSSPTGFTTIGLSGDDTITGSDANDTLMPGYGTDVVDGGDGVDTVSFSDAAYGTFRLSLTDERLNNGAAAGDAYDNIENITMSRGNDVAYGNAQVNVIAGGDGNDTLFGVDNDDRLHGENGNDTLYGGLGTDTFLFNTPPNTATNMDTIGDFESGIDLIGLATTYFGEAEDSSGDVRLYQGDGITGQDVHALLGAILFDTDTGNLQYDSDGAGNAAAVQFAMLEDAHSVDQTDFFLV